MKYFLQFCVIGNNWIYKYKNFYYAYPQWKFFDFFTEYFNVILIAPVKKVTSVNEVKGIKLEKLQIVELPFFEGSINQVKKFYLLPKVLKKYYKVIKKSDIVVIFTSDLFATFGLLISALRKKNVVFMIGENWEKDVKFKYNSNFMCNCVKILRKIQEFFLKLTPNKLVFVTSEALNPFKNIPVYTYFMSLISKKEIYYRNLCPLFFKKNINILYVGFLIKAKGVHDLIKAVELLKKKNRNIVLHIVGDGEYRSILENLAKEKKIQSKFYGFIGDREKLKNIYLNADIFVLPSYTEGYPKVIFEAMSKGLPVIASSVGGIPEIIRHKCNGLLFVPGDILELKKCIENLINDFELYKSIVTNGYSTIKKYTVEESIKNFIKIFEKEFKIEILTQQKNNYVNKK